MEPDYIFSVSEYIDLLNETLKIRKFTIQGEITKFTARGGTVFFTIADKEDDATLECLIWKSVFESLGIELEEGLEVKITGTANVYKKNGRLSFLATRIVPLGEGALKKAFEKLKKQLEEKGYFSTERKRPIPTYVKNIGLITANGSDAKKDFETHIGNFGYKVYFHDVKVEGVNSVKDIVRAFDTFNSSTLDIDVLVLTRGGGSMESLMGFNSEEIAKAIYKSRIPVICAVGHENDVSIADLVADLRASTPTHAGRIISQPYKDLSTVIQDAENKIIKEYATRLGAVNEAIKESSKNIKERFRTSLSRIEERLENLYITQTFALQNVLNRFERIESVFINNLEKYERAIKVEKNNIGQIEELLKANDPKIKLKQGYSITKNSDGKIIKSSKDVNIDDILETVIFDGEIKSKIITN